jgi:hypothetical protein
MARKTTGTVPSRSKKVVQPAVVETSPVLEPVIEREARKSEKTATVTSINRGSVNLNLNLEDAIRRRAYELYLERRATAGADQGDENQDWLLAEREVRSGSQGQHTA